MRQAGRIKSWNADKGYGFIDVHADLKDVFFHVTALQNRAVPPKPGDRVSFELGTGKDGRKQAINVAIAGAAAPAPRGNADWLRALLGLVALLGVTAGGLAGYLPRQAGLVCLLSSLIAFAAYAHDKRQASKQAWRTPESHLHLIALFGGWPGALAAQHLLRHKNRKASFQAVFWLTALLNVAVLAWMQHAGIA
jgi:uncharacterized membrane protein YsdA (DUF1294 family)/cold shock CspA family protein